MIEFFHESIRNRIDDEDCGNRIAPLACILEDALETFLRREVEICIVQDNCHSLPAELEVELLDPRALRDRLADLRASREGDHRDLWARHEEFAHRPAAMI